MVNPWLHDIILSDEFLDLSLKTKTKKVKRQLVGLRQSTKILYS